MKSKKESPNRKSRIFADTSFEFVLEKLSEEWNLAPRGYRKREEYPVPESNMKIVAEEGLHATIVPERLMGWCRERNFTLSQLSPLLNRAVKEGFLKSFDYFEGSWTENDSEHTALNIEFAEDFEYRLLQKDKKVLKVGDDKIWTRTNFHKGVLNVLVGKREWDEGQKTHLFYGKTGEIRIDENDVPPGEIFEKIESVLSTKDGKKIIITLTFE